MLDPKKLGNLPSPFYRVTAKALIFDEQNRLLVYKNKEGHYEIPGGGWEYGETFEDCLRRELMEELGVQPAHISRPVCFWARPHKDHGFMMLRIGAYAELASTDFTENSEHEAVQFVTQDEFMALPLGLYEGDVQTQSATIWSEDNRGL